MRRNNRTICALLDFGCPKACVSFCTCDELPCPLITWLVSELKQFCHNVEGERVPKTVLAGDLRAFLKKLSCPYTKLTSDALTPVSLNHITEYLVSELQAARMILYRQSNPEDKEISDESVKDRRMDNLDEEEVVKQIGDCQIQDERTDKYVEATKRESNLLLEALQMNASASLMDVEDKVKTLLSLLPGGDIPKPLLKNEVDSDQWKQLEKINIALTEDYSCRKQMLMKRFEVTLQSFTWGEKGKDRARAVSSISLLPLSAGESCISLASMLAAREDQSRIQPVKAGPSTAVHKVLMGSVPDRGGRPGEIEPPMPDWKRERAHGDNSQRRHRFRKKSRK